MDVTIHIPLLLMPSMLLLLSTLLSAVTAAAGDSAAANIARSSLHEQLASHDVLLFNSVKVRSVDTGVSRDRTLVNSETRDDENVVFIEFQSHGRQFTVRARPTQGLFGRNVRLYERYNNGTVREPYAKNFDRVRRRYLEGEVVGEPQSHAALYYSGETLTGSIYLRDEVYTIEDASFSELRPTPTDEYAGERHQKGLSHLTVYKDSEINHIGGAGRSGCTAEARGRRRSLYSVDDEHHYHYGTDLSPDKKRCPIRLVADHTYFSIVGEGNAGKTIDKMVTQIQRVNVIFNGTAFANKDSDGFFNTGFVIHGVKVHTEPTAVIDGRTHYNAAGEISADDMLYSFATEEAEENQWVCLAHLFTARDLDDGALGKAFLGHVTAERGICAGKTPLDDGTTRKFMVQNVGLTTSMIMGTRLLTRLSDISVAHELGHGWGAEHDPDTPECLPDERHGGAYIMNAHANSGRNVNHRQFSPCTIRQVMVMLKHKSTCFVEDVPDTCGNFIVNDDEECDVGSIQNHPCCTSSCRLRETAICSDLNHACCSECQMAAQGTLCKARLPNECLGDSFCSGESERCPPQRALPDNTSCSDRGTCVSGQCLPFCESIGRVSCLCEHGNACYRCCRTSPLDACVPVQPLDQLVDGTLCKDGFCKAGRCRKKVQDVVSRLVDIIRTVSPSWIVGVLQRYLVSIVIVSMSLLWIPCAIALHYYDRRKYSFWSTPAPTKRDSLMPLHRNSAFVGEMDREPLPGRGVLSSPL